MIYQTDFKTGYPQRTYIAKYGCLVCSLVRSVELMVTCEMSVQHFLQMIDRLHFEKKTSWNQKYPALSAEGDITKEGVFVWDHEAVLNEAAHTLGSSTKFRYVGCQWMTQWETGKRGSWGRTDSDFIIINTQTPNTGHFRLMDWDPVESGTTTVDIKGVRYYEVL